MVTIKTKFHGATNFRGSRVSATSTNGHRLTVDWDHALDCDENHDAAAVALCRKMDWHGTIIRGHGQAGNFYVFDNNWSRIEVRK